MKKTLFLIVAIFLIVLLFVLLIAGFFQKKVKYNEEWIVGKTKEQIIEKYGDFEWYTPQKDANDQITCYVGRYTIKPKVVGLLGTKQATYFCIKFNTEEVATECYEEQAGKGG